MATTFVFGSEIKALLAHPAVSRELDLTALRLYLECQFVPAPHTIFAGIRKLPPGHELRLRGGKLDIRRFWRPDYADKFALDDTDATAALDRELRASVDGMLIADVPVGAFVSGGVDSALIAALMTDIRGASDRHVQYRIQRRCRSASIARRPPSRATSGAAITR